jgi:hypothetical protein
MFENFAYDTVSQRDGRQRKVQSGGRMSFVKPKYSKKQINRAGEILISDDPTESNRRFADEVLANYRAAHGYPINTFQATLRAKLKTIDDKAIVAQRLKRTPSIVLKLKRFEGMKLARMQDIGGLTGC